MWLGDCLHCKSVVGEIGVKKGIFKTCCWYFYFYKKILMNSWELEETSCSRQNVMWGGTENKCPGCRKEGFPCIALSSVLHNILAIRFPFSFSASSLKNSRPPSWMVSLEFPLTFSSFVLLLCMVHGQVPKEQWTLTYSTSCWRDLVCVWGGRCSLEVQNGPRPGIYMDKGVNHIQRKTLYYEGVGF